MVSNEETILKRGYLDRLGPRTESDGWERLYFVLYGSSAKNEARLDWFDSRRCSESNSGLRNGIFLEEISRVERLLCPPSTDDDDGGGGGSTCGRQRQSQPPPGPARTTLALYPLRQKKPILLRCGDDDEDSVDEWMRQLEAALKMTKTPSSEGGKTKVSSRDNGDNAEPIYTPSLHTAHASTGCDTMTFDAEVEETKASSRQGLFGCYRLVISRQHLSLLDPTDSTTVLTWHYSHVRRFGYSDRSFSIEGGQRSGSGQGLFILKTHDGQRLFEDIQLRIRSLKSSSPSDNSSCASSAATTLPPEGEEGSCTGGVKGQPPIPPRIYPPLNGANGHFGMTSSSNKSSPKTKRDKKDEGQGQMTESPARMDHLEMGL